MKWYLIANERYNENTGEYGYGDYPETICYLAAIVEADTERKAQNQAKKIYPGLSFSKSSPVLCAYLVSGEDWDENRAAHSLDTDADSRLTPNTQYLHNHCVKALREGVVSHPLLTGAKQ
jgi:hypothetical protein